MRRHALAAILLLCSCGVIPSPGEMRRQSYFEDFVGKHSSAVLETFGKPDDGVAIEPTADRLGGALATYYLPMSNGSTRKVVFVIDERDYVTRVNYWPK